MPTGYRRFQLLFLYAAQEMVNLVPPLVEPGAASFRRCSRIASRSPLSKHLCVE